MLGNKLLNIKFAKYHIWNNKSEGFPNMVLSTETFNQSVGAEYSEAVNARYTFQPLWVSDIMEHNGCSVLEASEAPFFMSQLLSKLDPRDNTNFEQQMQTTSKEENVSNLITWLHQQSTFRCRGKRDTDSEEKERSI